MKSLTPEAMRAKRKVVAKRMRDAADRARRGEPRYKLELSKYTREHWRKLKAQTPSAHHFRDSMRYVLTPEGINAAYNKVNRFYGLNNKYNADGSLKAGRA